MSVALSTFRSALDRMNEYPDFTFTASSAQFYEWVAETDPKMLRRDPQAGGRGAVGIGGRLVGRAGCEYPEWRIVGPPGALQPEAVPTVIRPHGADRLQPRLLRASGTLPQILKLQGMHGYVFMRPQAHEKKLPADLFWWEGADGTRLLTYRIPYSYGIRKTSARQVAATSFRNCRSPPRT